MRFISSLRARLLQTGRGARGGVLAIGSGSLAGQLILTATTPVLSRIYPPESFGTFSLLLAIAAVVGPVATLKFEAALVLPRDDDDARRLFRLGMVAALIISVLTVVAIVVIQQVGFLPLDDSLGLTPLWVGVMVLLTSTFAVLSQAALRLRSYSSVAKRSVAQALGTAVGQVALGTLTQTSVGLLGGYVAGRSLGYIPLIRVTRDLWRRPKRRRKGYMILARKYWRFPLVFTPSGLLNALGSQMPLLLIAFWFGAAVAGELAIAQRLVLIPLTLIGASVGEVFGAEIAKQVRDEAGGSRRLYLRASLLLTGVGIAVALGFLTLGPWLMPIILGEQWVSSGSFAQAMSVSVAAGLIASPVSKVYVVFQQSLASILVDISRLGLLLCGATVIALGDLTPVAAVWVLYCAQAANYVITWLYGLRIVSAPNRRMIAT
jgi:O-antigen/teichoic acid export membrane protein